MKRTLTAILVSCVLSACGGGSEYPTDTGTPNLGAAGPTDTTDTDNTELPPEPVATAPYEQSTLDYSAQQAAEQSNQTGQIAVSAEFDFRTSQNVSVLLDFPEARGQRATVLICTDYSGSGNSYNVDYNSCLVRAPLVDGRLAHDMQVLTRYDKALGVVWFAEPGNGPLYQEIELQGA